MHEILSFSSREALFNRLSALFFMTASVYFIGLFSSNTHSLLRCSLLSLIWCSLAQQKQQIVKMRSWRTRRRLRLCVCAELPVRGAAPHPHPHPRVARAAASPVPRRTSAETESQRRQGPSGPRASCARARQRQRPQGRAEPTQCPLPSAMYKFGWAQCVDLSCCSSRRPLPPIIHVLQGSASGVEAC